MTTDESVDPRRFTPAERTALASTVVGGSLVPLNSTMLAVALADIADDMGVAPGRAALLVTSYLIVMLIAQPIAGRFGDRVGHRPVAIGSLVVFVAASLLAAAAPSFWVLVAARSMQALGGAGFSPNSSAMLRHTIAAMRRGRAFGLVGSGIGTGAAVGPVFGGLLIAAGSWRLLFLANVPVVIAALYLVTRIPSRGRDPSEERHSMVSLLRVPAFAAACLTQSATTVALYGALLVLPIVLAAAGWASGTTGFAVSALTLGILVLSPVGGRLGDRIGRVRVIVTGMVIAVAGAVMLAVFIDDAPLLILGSLVMGCGQGLAGASLQTAAVEAAPLEAAGSASGLFSTSRYVGSISVSLLIAALAVDNASSARPVTIAIVVASGLAVITGGQVAARRQGLALAD